MTELSALADRVGMLAKKSEEILAQTLEDNDAFIEDAVTEQMFAGRRADGSEILPSYTAFTEQIKRAKGQPADRVTLRDSGGFYNSVTSQVSKIARELNITATDEKTPSLLRKYDVRDQLLNLSEDNRKELEQVYIIEDQIIGLTKFLETGQ